MKLKFVQLLLVVSVLEGCSREKRIADLNDKAFAAVQNDNYEEAINKFTEVIQLDPRSADTFTMRGNAFIVCRRFDDAIKDLDKAIQLNPNDPSAYLLRGTAYYASNQWDRAISDFGLALKANLETADDFKTRGRIFKMRGLAYYSKCFFTNAIDDLTQAAKFRPDDPDIYETCGNCYDLKIDTEKALKAFNKAIQLNPKATTALLGRGRIRSRAGAYTNAIQDFERVIEFKPKASAAYNSLAWLLATCPDERFRNGRKAVEFATKACAISGWTSHYDVDTLAAAYAESGDFDQAVKYQKLAEAMNGIPADSHTNAHQRLELYLQHRPYRIGLFRKND